MNLLVRNEDEGVRAAVAEQGYGLNILVSDSFSDVKNAVLEHNYGLEKLAKDENPVIASIAQAKINLQKLKESKNH